MPSERADFSVGLAAKFSGAFAEAGGTTEELNSLAESGDKLRSILTVLRGQAEIAAVKHAIDLDAPPLVPYNGWTVEEHQTGGELKWDPTKVELHFSPNQMEGKTIEGNKLRKELGKMPVPNANVLDYLLDHPHLIPENWKRNAKNETLFVYFWGTIYRGSGGYLYVRYLYFGGGHWQADSIWLDDHWGGQSPAARLAS